MSAVDVDDAPCLFRRGPERSLGAFRRILITERVEKADLRPAAGGAAAAEGFSLGLGGAELRVMLLSLAALFAVDLCNSAGIQVRRYLLRLPLPVRWVCYLAVVYVILIFGIYGPDFSESQFIYFQF